MTVLYKTGQLYTDGKFAKDQAIVVEDGLIKAIGPTKALQEKYRGVEEIDWHDKALVPGTINAHNHSFQSLLRGIAVDRPFLEWRDEALYKYTPLLDEEAIYTGALFAFGEMLKYGATTVSDFFYVHNNGTKTDEAVIQAANDLGIRLVMARTMYDWMVPRLITVNRLKTRQSVREIWRLSTKEMRWLTSILHRIVLMRPRQK